MRRSRALLVVGFAILGFVAVTAVRTRPADPVSRLPRRYRLATLIQRQQRSARRSRDDAIALSRQLDRLRSQSAGQQAGQAAVEQQLTAVSTIAGLVPVRGPGLRVTLDDSGKSASPSGDVNDLVIHSQDVQAVVNALWRAGAEAVAINQLRLVGTSAVLCVGNTLLLNGTVQSPPYVVTAVGASRDRFEADQLVRRLHDAAKTFGLRFSIVHEGNLELAAYKGPIDFQQARPTS